VGALPSATETMCGSVRPSPEFLAGHSDQDLAPVFLLSFGGIGNVSAAQAYFLQLHVPAPWQVASPASVGPGSCTVFANGASTILLSCVAGSILPNNTLSLNFTRFASIHDSTPRLSMIDSNFTVDLLPSPMSAALARIVLPGTICFGTVCASCV